MKIDAPFQILNLTNTTSKCHRHQLRQKINNVRQTNHQTPSTPTKTPGMPNKTPSEPDKTSSTPNKTPGTPNKTTTPTKTSTPTKTPKTAKKTQNKILIYAVLLRYNFCREFTHFFGVPFTGLKNVVAYQK